MSTTQWHYVLLVHRSSATALLHSFNTFIEKKPQKPHVHFVNLWPLVTYVSFCTESWEWEITIHIELAWHFLPYCLQPNKNHTPPSWGKFWFCKTQSGWEAFIATQRKGGNICLKMKWTRSSIDAVLVLTVWPPFYSERNRYFLKFYIYDCYKA